MTSTRFLIALSLITTGCEAQTQNAANAVPVAEAMVEPVARDVSITTSDGIKLSGTHYQGDSPPNALILQFHQAGSNKAEYTKIAPKLVNAGYAVLAIDQRSGGKNFGATNQTVDALGKSTAYLEAKPDLEAAIAWAETKKLPIIIWGSSYSAALVYLIAAENPDKVKAALVFSGGNYLGGDRVTKAARAVTIPIFATSAKDEVAVMKPILESTKSAQKVFFTPGGPGVHGSSILNPDKNPGGAAEAMTAVLAFLDDVTKG